MKFSRLCSLLLENNEVANLLPIDELRNHSKESGEFVTETNSHLLIKPNSHRSACHYGQYSRSRFCIANPDDSSDWNMLASLQQQMGQAAKFYFVFSKVLSAKNKNALYGIVVYPRMWSQMAVNMTDEQLVEQGKQRFRDEVGGELAYSDEYLLEWVQQIKKYDNLFESYNSKNKIILPDDLRSQIGDELFFYIIRS